MPNTLAHLGTQGILNHLVKRGIDPKLVALGCLLPDVPWILKRIVTGLELSSNPYTTHIYFTAQASLLITLCLCGALAFLSQKPKEIFLILGINSLLHLLLDGLQIKLANGVHFFAPFSWELWNIGLFWPESFPTYILTGCGLIYIVGQWNNGINQPTTFQLTSLSKIALSLMMFFLYICLPFVFMEGPRQADNHFVRTFEEKDSRIGKTVAFDRRPYIKTSSEDVVQVFGKERIKISPPQLDHSATISGLGTFTASGTVELREIHEHIGGLRDASSILGILLIIALWSQTFFKYWQSRKHMKS